MSDDKSFRVVQVRIDEELLQKADRVIRDASTGLVEVSYVMLFSELLSRVPESEIVAMLTPKVQELDRQRGEARRLKQRKSQLRIRIKRYRSEGKHDLVQKLTAELAELEAQHADD